MNDGSDDEEHENAFSSSDSSDGATIPAIFVFAGAFVAVFLLCCYGWYQQRNNNQRDRECSERGDTVADENDEIFAADDAAQGPAACPDDGDGGPSNNTVRACTPDPGATNPNGNV